MICLINDGGINNRLLIKCSRNNLRDNYAIEFTDNYLTDTDSKDSITEFYYFTYLHYVNFLFFLFSKKSIEVIDFV